MRTVIRKNGKSVIFLLFVFILCLGFKSNVYASGGIYDICNAEFIDRTETETPAILGTWSGAEDKTNYTVRLYKGTKLLSSRVVKATTIDFSSILILKTTGAGKYSFTVTTTKGNVRIESDTMEVTSKMVSLIRTRIEKERKTARAKAGGGWEKGPGNIWLYYDSSGDQVKGRWIEVDGFRYYLDSTGIMQTGWHYLGGKHYYLEPEGSAGHPLGSMWRSATTPDGHQVDANGARIGDIESAPATRENIVSAVSIYLKEQQTPGEYTKLLGITCGNGVVSNISYSSDPATWNNNSVGTVTFDVQLNKGLKLTVLPKLTCSRAASARVLNRTGTGYMRIELQYLSRYVLKVPECFVINMDGRISWDKVDKASGYKVTVTSAETDASGTVTRKAKTYTVSTPKFVLSENGYFDETEIEKITVQAIGNSQKTTANSAVVTLPALTELRAKHTVEGEFRRVGSGLTYTDESGNYAYGWQELGGYWYFFRNTGYAAGPGWYQDKDKNWYYFDEHNRMVTGQIVDNGKTYTLNDGSSKKLPLGALLNEEF